LFSAYVIGRNRKQQPLICQTRCTLREHIKGSLLLLGQDTKYSVIGFFNIYERRYSHALRIPHIIMWFERLNEINVCKLITRVRKIFRIPQ